MSSKKRKSNDALKNVLTSNYKWVHARYKGHCSKCRSITESGEKVLRNTLEPQSYLCEFCGKIFMAKISK